MIPDLSVFWVILSVLVLATIQNQLLFKPLTRVIAEREAAVQAARLAGKGPFSKDRSVATRLPLSGDIVCYLASESYDPRDALITRDGRILAERFGRRQAGGAGDGRLWRTVRAGPETNQPFLECVGPWCRLALAGHDRDLGREQVAAVHRHGQAVDEPDLVLALLLAEAVAVRPEVARQPLGRDAPP